MGEESAQKDGPFSDKREIRMARSEKQICYLLFLLKNQRRWLEHVKQITVSREPEKKLRRKAGLWEDAAKSVPD